MRATHKRFGWKRLVETCALLGSGAMMLAFVGITGAAHTGGDGVTWNGTVSRILQTRCVSCHSAFGGARPRLDDYEEATLAAAKIKEAVLTRRMPPWYAQEGFGDFGNDPTLTPQEIELLATWADARGPEGRLRPPRPDLSASHSPEPDVLLTVPAKHRIAEGPYTFRLPAGATRDRWIRGWVFRPGNRSLIRSAVLRLASGATLGTWVRGEDATFFPDGVAQRLSGDESIVLTIDYADPQGPAVDASSVGLYLSGQPALELAHMVLPCGSSQLPRAIDVLAIRPPSGSAALSLTVIARRPDHGVEPLGRFQAYPSDHPQTYWCRAPVMLPAGTWVDVHAFRGLCGAELDYTVSNGHAVHRPAVDMASPDQVITTTARTDAPPARDEPGEYWCPMHPDVRAEVAGTCVRCGMTLLPMNPAVEGKYDLEAMLQPRASHARNVKELRLLVKEPGTHATVRRFEKVHDRPFHLFAVSRDLEQFVHVHPTSRPDDWLEVAGTLLPTGSAYEIYADFLPVGGTPQLIRKTIAKGPPEPQFIESRTPHLLPDLRPKEDHGLLVRIEPESGVLVAGKPTLIDFTLADAAGEPISDLEPYLGAWGHMFILSADLTDAVHSHPITELTSPGGPRIVFLQRFPRAGTYRLWAQFQRGGRVATVSFTIAVVEPPLAEPLVDTSGQQRTTVPNR
jgi:heavy metal-binding protein